MQVESVSTLGLSNVFSHPLYGHRNSSSLCELKKRTRSPSFMFMLSGIGTLNKHYLSIEQHAYKYLSRYFYLREKLKPDKARKLGLKNNHTFKKKAFIMIIIS